MLHIFKFRKTHIISSLNVWCYLFCLASAHCVRAAPLRTCIHKCVEQTNIPLFINPFSVSKDAIEDHRKGDFKIILTVQQHIVCCICMKTFHILRTVNWQFINYRLMTMMEIHFVRTGPSGLWLVNTAPVHYNILLQFVLNSLLLFMLNAIREIQWSIRVNFGS